MENILLKSLNTIDEIISNADIRTIGFYKSAVEVISSLFSQEQKTVALFFFESTECALKSSNKEIKSYKFPQNLISKLLNSKENSTLLKTEKDGFLENNTLLVKLSIKESVFGFGVLSTKNPLSQEEIKAFETVINVLSYKIKDFELNEVFKIQLKSLQEAIVEKEDAFSVIKKQHKKLQEADKTKNLFLANISHELRTPLNAIIGFSQALGAKIFGDLNEKQSEYIKDIQISSLHLLGMINEILDISKLEARAMKFSPIELNCNTIIQEVVNILEPLYQNKNIEVKLDLNYDGIIYADYQKFQQILYNLLSNAIKFTNENGKIEIISEQKKKNYILKIKDNGIGIDKKFHSKIFKKFVHVNNMYTKNQSSTGLGLTITKELVKLHNGKISLVSELNKGTTFIMEFKNIIREQ